MTSTVKAYRLAAHPQGVPQESDFLCDTITLPPLADDQLRLRITHASLDPALRPRMNAVSAYAGAVGLGEVIPAPAIGEVVESTAPAWPVGSFVSGMFGWQEEIVTSATGLWPVDPRRAALPDWLGVLGLSSFTAWAGITKIGKPQAGETVVVSAAGGATGSMAGQYAKIHGARVVGIAGGQAKCARVVDDFGFDACVDYRASDFLAQLDRACPDGVDVNYENVGGAVMEAVYERMNIAGRMVLCGMVSEYSAADAFRNGPSMWPIVYKSLRVEGFRASRYWHLMPEFTTQVLGWREAGLLRSQHTLSHGFQSLPKAFISMLKGENFGKAMVAF